MNTIRVSNGLGPDQDRRSVGPDLGPNCLQKLLAEDKTKELNYKITSLSITGTRYNVNNSLPSSVVC